MPNRKADMKKKNVNLLKLKKIKITTKSKGRMSVDKLLSLATSLPIPGADVPTVVKKSKSGKLPPLAPITHNLACTTSVLSTKLHQGPVDLSPRKRVLDDERYISDLDSGQNSQRSLALSARNADGWDSNSLASLGSLGSSSSSKFMPASSKKVYTVFDTSDVDAPPVERTMREMITDIGVRAKNHKPRPLYLPTMDELPANVTSWNGNSLDTLGTATSNIDIMPCHQPLELVLVLADERARKRTALLEAKSKLAEEKRTQLENGIYEKFHRVQLYQQDIRRKNVQASWARIIFVADYAEKFAEKYRRVLKSKRSFFHEFRAAMLLKKEIMKWRKRVVVGRYSM